MQNRGSQDTGYFSLVHLFDVLSLVLILLYIKTLHFQDFLVFATDFFMISYRTTEKNYLGEL